MVKEESMKPMTDNERVAREIRGQIAYHLEEIRKIFTAPKITLLVRNGDDGRSDVLLTDDEISQAVLAIHRLYENPAVDIPPDSRPV